MRGPRWELIYLRRMPNPPYNIPRCAWRWLCIRAHNGDLSFNGNPGSFISLRLSSPEDWKMAQLIRDTGICLDTIEPASTGLSEGLPMLRFRYEPSRQLSEILRPFIPRDKIPWVDQCINGNDTAH